MPEYGLTEKGFLRKPYTAIIADKEDRAKTYYGEDTDLSERSPLGLFIRSIAWEESRLWDEMENVYYSAYIDDAAGRQLDGLVRYIGIKRKPEQKALGSVEISGMPGKTVEAGTRLMTDSSVLFQTTEDVTLSPAGHGIADIEAILPGKTGNVTENRINRLFNPVQGIDRVSNPVRTGGGTAAETDEELRERYYRSLFRKGKATREAVEAALLDIPNVRDACVKENTAMETVDGIPPKSLAPYVFGGDDRTIAAAILDTKSGGIQSFGETVADIYDSRNYPHKIGFTRAKDIPVYVDIVLRKNVMFRPGFENTIRTEVLKYIGGLDADGTEYRGLGLGQAVMRSKIIALADDTGIDDVDVRLSTDGISYMESNIQVPVMQIAATDYEKVAVL